MMFKYTVDNSELLTEFMEMFSKYLNKSYKYGEQYAVRRVFVP